MNENELYVVQEYKFDNPIITEIDSIIDKFFTERHKSYFHNFKYECIYDIKITIITNNEIINLTISGKSMGLFEINKKLTDARQNGFIFNRKKTLKIKIHSHLRYINIRYYLKCQLPMCHRHFYRLISQNGDYVENFAMIWKILFILHVRIGLKIVCNFIS